MRQTRDLGVVALIRAEAWVLVLAVGFAYPTTASTRPGSGHGLAVQLLLVGDCLVLMPVGWISCLLGSRRGLYVAIACMGGMLAVALVAASIWSSSHEGAAGVVTFLDAAVPVALLGSSLLRVGRTGIAGVGRGPTG